MHNYIYTETPQHAIEMSEGCLTIGTTVFPDQCISLSPEETRTVLQTLLQAQQASDSKECVQ